MFSTGVALVWLGLRRRPDRLPSGAHDVLVAVMEGRLARPPHAINLVHPPAERPRAAQPTPAVRLLPKADAPVPGPKAEPGPKAAPEPGPKVAPEPTVEVTAERPIPATAAAVPEAAPEPEIDVTEPEPEPVATQKRDLTHALFDGIDDPSTPESAFFATKPQLQRF